MTKIQLSFPSFLPLMAVSFRQVLLDELLLTPKPGLVDYANSGAHQDMDYALFLRSIDAITPWFLRFIQLGYTTANTPIHQLLSLIRPVGIACEQAMFTATQGVNTHKGAIFSLGLLASAMGRMTALQQRITREALCEQIRQITQGLVQRELQLTKPSFTAGEKLYQSLRLTGIRGEVESGFQTVRQHVLPYWDTGQDRQRTLHQALLRLMAVNQDTNLVSRGGMAGLNYVQNYAQRLLLEGWDIPQLIEMDQQLTLRNLSPGGSADLLSVAQILQALPSNN